MSKENYLMKMSRWAPAPPNETEEYKKFNDIFSKLSVIFSVSIAYLILLIFEDEILYISENFIDYFSLFKGRFYYIYSIDKYSSLSFLATLLSGIITMPIIIYIHFKYYMKTVVYPKKFVEVGPITLIYMIFSLIIFSILLWLTFIAIIKPYNPKYPGMTRTFFWPLFPFFGGIFLSSFANFIFYTIVGLLKFAFMRGDHRDHFQKRRD